jgi:hypothetical protein
MTSHDTQRRIEVGDKVMIVAGRTRIPARVIEDRGNLGPEGERVLAVLADLGEGARDMYREHPEFRFKLIEPAA